MLAGNHFSRPHFHPNDRFITVLKGVWWVGSGTKFEPNNTVPMPAGAFVTHFGKQVHFDGAKDEDAVLLSGRGAWDDYVSGREIVRTPRGSRRIVDQCAAPLMT
jgi:hypothetical protein